MPRQPARIVVGVDGSSASLAALRWAAGEAAAHGAPLVAVYVSDPRLHRFAPYAGARSSESDASGGIAAVQQMISDSGIAGVHRVFEVGIPCLVLVRIGIGARMLVLGHGDGHRRWDGEMQPRAAALGSVARACVARATCPVVIVPIPERRPACKAVEPAPRHVPVAQGAPLRGGRAIFPKRQPVPSAYVKPERPT